MKRMICVAALVFVFGGAASGDDVANVNGKALTKQDLHILQTLQGLPADVSDSVQAEVVRELIDRELIRQFLERSKVTADADQLATARGAIERARDRAELAEQDREWLRPDNERVVAEVLLPSLWRNHVSRVVTEEQIREHFANHRHRLDGTRLRVAQIFRKYESGETSAQAPKTTATLAHIRESIVKEETSFADAARAGSQAPTAEQGGDVGWIGPRGGLPVAVSDAAYALKPGDVSEVVLSPFGAHIVTVTEVEPGELSLEDARPAVLSELSRSLWNETVAAERKTAKIVLSE